MAIQYAVEPDLAVEEFRQVLAETTLGERRPLADLPRLQQMLLKADIVATARDGSRLVGVARALTDFAYCCYLSDLAVSQAWQGRGIGRRLIQQTRELAGDRATLLLVAAPGAVTYYPHIGLEPVPSCWAIPRTA